ncbi:hypothetical protein RA272_31345, partial [Pseudomonas syringae pv. tagetis]|uniref:hypothetical protein n=1 Tax=Pseudomonas syringae group genomosp. 7 TaxID=251699 RepID=UPI0037706DAC
MQQVSPAMLEAIPDPAYLSMHTDSMSSDSGPMGPESEDMESVCMDRYAGSGMASSIAGLTCCTATGSGSG